jgi:DNA polymerase elongation subunit (family B)
MARNRHGEVMSYENINSLCERNDFLDEKEFREIEHKLHRGEDILFMPNAIHEKNIQDEKYQKSKYKIVVFGVLRDGRKVSLILDNIKVFFDVKIPDEEKDDKEDDGFCLKLLNKLRNTEYEEYGRKTSYEPLDEYHIIEAKPFKYFQEERDSYMRIYFNKLTKRRSAIKFCREQGYETASDDLYNYYRVVCRNYKITFSNWCLVSNYVEEVENVGIKGNVYRIDINDYKPLEWDIEHDESLAWDKTLEMDWDIETYSPEKEIPKPNHPNDKVFMIGIAFQWYNSRKDVLQRICLVDHPCDPHPNHLTIICENERNIIDAFGIIIKKMRPDFIFGFNDADYDWKWIVERARMYPNVLTKLCKDIDMVRPYNVDNFDDDNFYKRYYKKFKVKIEADKYVTGASLQAEGYTNSDVMIMFRRLHPTDEFWSLNWFLMKYKLSKKEEMSIRELFRIYGEIDEMLKSSLEIENIDKFGELKRDMAKIANYCVIDAQRCHDLMIRENVVMDRREIAHQSYTSVHDSFYFADGMRVRNMVIAEGQNSNILFSDVKPEIEEGKYPGAYVFPPERGLIRSKLSLDEKNRDNKGRKTIPEEKISVYKQIIEKYGAVLEEEEVKEIERKENIKFDEFFIDFAEEKIKRPITGLDFASLYPSLIMAYNLSPEYIITDKRFAKRLNKEKEYQLHRITFKFNGRDIKGWSVRHENIEEKFGIYPRILRDLFKKRKDIKENHLSKYKKEVKKLRDILKSEEEDKKIEKEYNETLLKFNYYNSKQKALKTFMVTFYGQAGTKYSSFFLLQLAGGITAAGKYNIRKAERFVREQGCRIHYGDSVPEDTPVLIRYPDTNNVDIRTIDDIPAQSDWIEYPQFKLEDPLIVDKQQNIPAENIEMWTSSGWRRIIRVVRHKTNKQLFRVSTHMGCVDVTEDHSLLDITKESFKPCDAKVGDELFHSFPCEFPDNVKDITEEEAFNIGCSTCEGIPYCILNSPISIRRAFLDGYYCADRYKKSKLKNGTLSLACKGKLLAQGLYYLLKSLGYENIVIRIRNDKDDIYSIRGYNSTKYKYRVNSPRAIKKIFKIPHISDESFVYDVETEDGTFLAGVGSINVHNTDSLYISLPDRLFTDFDKLYYSGKISKLEYWTNMVEITKKEIMSVRDAVNKMLAENNGTNFLEMAYEEVLYPVIFLSKKKYFGIAHEEKVNFMIEPDEIFVRGLEAIKRGKSGFLRKIYGDIMLEAVNINNTKTLLQIVQDKIDEIYETKWDFKYFGATVNYRSDKNNVKVHTFVNRMERIGIKVEKNQRFEYIIVKKPPYIYDHRGRKKTTQIGDKMEYVHIAKQRKMEPDLDYYMYKSTNSQLARLIMYHEMFYVSPENESDEAYKVAELKTLDNAKKYVDQYCDRHKTQHIEIGEIYKKIFKIIEHRARESYIDMFSVDKTIIDLLSVPDIENFPRWVVNRIESIMRRNYKKRGETEKIHEKIDAEIKNYGKKNNTEEETKEIKKKKGKANSTKKLYHHYNSERQTILTNQDDLVKQLTDCKSITFILSKNVEIVENVRRRTEDILHINAEDTRNNEVLEEYKSSVEDADENGTIREIVVDEIKRTSEVEIKEALDYLEEIYNNLYDCIKSRFKVDIIIEYLEKSVRVKNGIVASSDLKKMTKSCIDDLSRQDIEVP